MQTGSAYQYGFQYGQFVAGRVRRGLEDINDFRIVCADFNDDARDGFTDAIRSLLAR